MSARLIRTEPVGPLRVLEEWPRALPTRAGGQGFPPGLGMLVEVTGADAGC